MNAQGQTPKVSPHPKHLRDRVWQIWVPMGAAVLVVLGVMVYAVILATGGGNNVEEWASVSLILLILPALLGALIILAITAGLAFLVTMLIGRLPYYTRKVRVFLLNLNRTVERIGNQAAKPFVAYNSWRAGVRRGREALARPENRTTP